MKNEVNYRILDCCINRVEFYVEFSDKTQIHLQPKILDVLNYLAKSYPRLVSREELIEQVWNNNVFVGEQALTNAIWSLRQTFKGQLNGIKLIDTVRKAGYRLTEQPVFLEDKSVIRLAKLDLKQTLAFGFLCVAVISAYVLFFQTEQSKEFKQLEIKSVTTEPGTEFYPAVSPDGNYVVFKWVKKNLSPDLYLKNINQPDLAIKRLTFDDQEEGGAAWSNNSQYLFYSKNEVNSNLCHVTRLNLKNLQEEKLFACRNEKFPQLAVSPQNDLLAFLAPVEGRQFPSVHILDLNNISSPPKIVNCTELLCEYRIRDLAFSPDESQLAVTIRVDDYDENVYVIDLTTFKLRKITENFFDILGLSWHEDNRRIVFGSQYSDIREGYVVDSHTNEVKKLGVKGFSFPRFIFGKEALVYHDKEEKYKIASLSTKTDVRSGLFPLVYSEYNHRNADYNAKSNRVVYVSNESGHYELWSSTLEGEKRKQLIYFEKEVSHPAWSNDGQFISFLGPNENKRGNSIYILNAKTLVIEKLNSKFEFHGRPIWSYDDQSIISSIIELEKSDLYRFSLDPSQSATLVVENGVFAQPNHNNEIYFTKSDKSLWKVTLNSEGSEVMVLNSEEFGSSFLWELTTEGIYYYSEEQQKHKINYYDFNSQRSSNITELAWLTDDKYGSFSYVDAHKQLLITISEFPQSDIKWLEHPLLAN